MKWKLLCILAGSLFLAGCATSRYKIAESDLDQNEYDLAIRHYLMMLEPRIHDGKRYILYDREAVTGIGIAYWYKQNYGAAIKIFNKVLEQDPDHGKALFFLGMSQEAMDQESEALLTYQKYTRLPENDPYRYFAFGRLDWLKKQSLLREMRRSLQNEDLRRFSDFAENSLAVTYFLNLSDDAQWAPLQKGLAHMMTRDLSQISNLVVADRELINALMIELGLNPVSVREPEDLERMARILGVRYMVIGSYLITDDLKMTLDTQIILAETNQVVTNMNFDGNLARFFKIEKELVMRIADFYGLFISEQERGSLLEIPTEDMAAFLSYCQGLDAMDQNNFILAQDYFHQALKFDKSFVNAQDYMVNPKIWEVAHNYNQMRVSYEVRQMVETTARGRARLVYTPPPDLVSAYNRLQWMGVQQNGQVIPGSNSRKGFIEASFSSAPIIPYMLLEPPNPPGAENP
jgi:TolB-like protein